MNTYSTLALAAGALAETTARRFEKTFAEGLCKSLTEAEELCVPWRDQIENSTWLTQARRTISSAAEPAWGPCTKPNYCGKKA